MHRALTLWGDQASRFSVHFQVCFMDVIELEICPVKSVNATRAAMLHINVNGNSKQLFEGCAMEDDSSHVKCLKSERVASMKTLKMNLSWVFFRICWFWTLAIFFVRHTSWTNVSIVTGPESTQWRKHVHDKKAQGCQIKVRLWL